MSVLSNGKCTRISDNESVRSVRSAQRGVVGPCAQPNTHSVGECQRNRQRHSNGPSGAGRRRARTAHAVATTARQQHSHPNSTVTYGLMDSVTQPSMPTVFPLHVSETTSVKGAANANTAARAQQATTNSDDSASSQIRPPRWGLAVLAGGGGAV